MRDRVSPWIIRVPITAAVAVGLNRGRRVPVPVVLQIVGGVALKILQVAGCARNLDTARTSVVTRQHAQRGSINSMRVDVSAYQ